MRTPITAESLPPPPPSHQMRPERGSAVIEFTFLAVILIVPVMYLIVALGRFQAAAFAVSLAAREAGRAFVTAPTEAVAHQRAEAAAALAFSDYGFAGQGNIEVACNRVPCLTPQASVAIRARVSAPLAWAPTALSTHLSGLSVNSTYLTTVDRFGARP